MRITIKTGRELKKAGRVTKLDLATTNREAKVDVIATMWVDEENRWVY